MAKQLLDACTIDWTSSHAILLRDTLSLAMQTEAPTRAFIERAGIQRRYVNWALPAIHFWMDIINLAASRQVLRRMVQNFLEDPGFAGFHGRLTPLVTAPDEEMPAPAPVSADAHRRLLVISSATASLAGFDAVLADVVERLNRQLLPEGVSVRIDARGSPSSPGTRALHLFVLGPSSSAELQSAATELMDAWARWRTAGQPDLLVYVSEGDRAIEMAPELMCVQRRYPGLFKSFPDVSGLGHLLATELSDYALRTASPEPCASPCASARAPLPSERSWLPAVEHWLACTSPAPQVRRGEATRLVRRLEELVDLKSSLTAVEQDALLAAAHVFVCVRRSGADALRDGCDADLAPLRVPARTLLAIARSAAQRAELGEVRAGAAAGSLRGDVLAGLLRIGEALLLDRVGMDVSEEDPDDATPLEAWASAFTVELRLCRGVASHALRSGSTAAAATLERWLLLNFVGCASAVRGALARANIAISMANPTISICRDSPDVPATVLERLVEASREAALGLASFRHLGDDGGAPSLDLLRPLPIGSLAEPMVIPVADADDYPTEMVLVPSTTDAVVTLTLDRERLTLDPARLRPGTTYRWTLRRDEGVGFTAVAEGELRTLSAIEAARWRMSAAAPPEIRRGLAVALGLRQLLLEEIWPTIPAGAPAADMLLALDILVDAYDWLRRHAPSSTQIDAARDLGGWVREQLDRRCSGDESLS